MTIAPGYTSTNIVALADLKNYLNLTDTSHDAVLTSWIAAATPVIEAITGPIVPRVYDEWYDGGNYFIHLRHRPAIVLIACDIYIGPVDYPESIVQDPQHGSIYSVMLDPSGDRIVRRGPGGGVQPFPKMPNSVHVIYEAGFAATPQNVWLGTLEFLREMWVATQTPGGPRTGSEAMMGVDSETAVRPPADFLVSPRVREWLTPNRRHPRVF